MTKRKARKEAIRLLNERITIDTNDTETVKSGTHKGCYYIKIRDWSLDTKIFFFATAEEREILRKAGFTKPTYLYK